MKLYNYTPKDDLTVNELSDIMKVLFVSIIEGIQGLDVRGADDLQIDDVIIKALPSELHRHFTKFEDTTNTIDIKDTIKKEET